MPENTTESVTPEQSEGEGTPTERPPRFNAADVAEQAFTLIKKAGEKGLSLKDLRDQLMEAGAYPGLDKAQAYRRVHNVTWRLEGGPATGTGVKDKGWVQLCERVSPGSKTYRVVKGVTKYQPAKG